MIKLVLKDFLIQKKTILLVIPYAFFVFFIFTRSFSVRGTYMIGIISIAYLFIIYSNGYDEKNNCYVMLNSLPIKRKDIVTAKYLSVIFFSIVGIIVTSTVGAILTTYKAIAGLRMINTGDVFWAAVSILLMYSIYYPVYFKYGQGKMKVMDIALYMCFIFGPNILISIDNDHIPLLSSIIRMVNAANPYFYMITTLVLLSAVLCSLFISTSIFEARDY